MIELVINLVVEQPATPTVTYAEVSPIVTTPDEATLVVKKNLPLIQRKLQQSSWKKRYKFYNVRLPKVDCLMINHFFS